MKYIIGIFLFVFVVGCKTSDRQKALTLYCAAGIKSPIEELARSYTDLYGIEVNIQYGGSGTLLANVRIAKQGDLYLAADKSYIDDAKHYGLIDETQALAIIKPVIALKKGNPKNISGFDDFLREDVSFALGNPDAASIGRLSKKILMHESAWDGIKEKVTVFKPTVNELLNDVHIGAVDACVAWDATVKQYSELETVDLPLFNEYKKNITVAVLKCTEQAAEALRFVRFISSPEHGNKVFDRMGYTSVKGDKWEEKPQLLFFSGGVNRVAIESTLQKFEVREGVDIVRVYNGCGILVSQIKSGQQPDGYLSCDLSFMTQVENRFTNICDVSHTDIVMAVKKGNPKAIQTLTNLTEKSLKLGVCNPQQSALGALTKKLLEGQKLWKDIYPNIRSQTPTADLLVNQLQTGSLDAVIVYRANLSQMKNKVDIIEINDVNAGALQNFGIEKNSDYKWMMKRLFKALTSDASKAEYLMNGFEWEFKAAYE